MSTNKNEKTPEQIFQEFWKEIICNPDGTFNEEQVKKELADFSFILEQIPKIYCHITGNVLSKVMYPADTVIARADYQVTQLIEEAKKDWQEEQDEELAELKEKAQKWDNLEQRIGKCYYSEGEDGEYIENTDPNIDLGTIGEIAASAFGFI